MTVLRLVHDLRVRPPPDGAGDAARPLHGRRLHGRAHVPRPDHAVPRALAVPRLPRRPAPRSGLEVVRQEPDHLLARRLAGAVLHPAHAGLVELHRAEPDGLPLGAVERHLQHGLVVPDQHQLAVLRRRDDDELLQPDGWAHRPELRLGGRRHRRRGRADPRDRQARRRPRRPARAASATSGRTWSARSSTSCCRSRSSSRSCSSPRARSRTSRTT